MAFMALEYKDNEKFEDLAPVLEDYTHWYSAIAFYVAYPEQPQEQLTTPTSFSEWVEKASQKGEFNSGVLHDMTDTYDQMILESQKVLTALAEGTKPDVKVFSNFKDFFRTFLSRIRRLEKDSAMEGSGIDEETGLRAPKAIKNDLKREMERLSRQGTSFAMVLARVDGFDEQTDTTQALKLSVRMIEKSMRPFDDAYYMGKGHFLLSLKQADIMGAEAAINRMRMHLQEDEENKTKMTMSFSVLEPSVGDDPEAMVKHMQQDLNDNMYEKDAVLKFKEVSALERFIGGMQ